MRHSGDARRRVSLPNTKLLTVDLTPRTPRTHALASETETAVADPFWGRVTQNLTAFTLWHREIEWIPS